MPLGVGGGNVPKPYSGLRSIGAANERDYDAGGTGLLGSRAMNDINDWNKFFGVEYNNDDYWYGGFDEDRSSGEFAEWYKNATPQERQAVITYTGYQYHEINQYLRNQNLDNAPDWVKETVANFDSGVAKFNLKEPITVWRGGSNRLVGGATTVEELNNMKGAIVIDRGITSTAVTKQASFMGSSSSGKMGYEIVYPKGRGRGAFVDPISENHGEQEFVAARNTRYEVLGGYTDNQGRTICRLKAVYGKKSKK